MSGDLKKFPILGTPKLRESNIKEILRYIKSLPEGEKYDVEIRPMNSKFTIQQCRGTFGIWLYEIVDAKADFPLDSNQRKEAYEYWYGYFKELFLTDIFINDQATKEQRIWAAGLEMALHYKLYKKARSYHKGTSHTWCTAKQMSEYMRRIEEWAINEGITLSKLDKKNANTQKIK